ncbi:hypothetical protein [Pseudoalteromonas sp. B62]
MKATASNKNTAFKLNAVFLFVGEVLYLAFYKVKLHEREINSHLQA